MLWKTLFTTGDSRYYCSDLSPLCPLVLLVKISWTQGRSLWSYEGKVTAVHCWSVHVHHRQEVVLWAGLLNKMLTSFVPYRELRACPLYRGTVLYQGMFLYVMDIHWENHTKHTIALCEQNAHCLNVPAGGIYIYNLSYKRVILQVCPYKLYSSIPLTFRRLHGACHFCL
jgi:hypothetical protein